MVAVADSAPWRATTSGSCFFRRSRYTAVPSLPAMALATSTVPEAYAIVKTTEAPLTGEPADDTVAVTETVCVRV